MTKLAVWMAALGVGVLGVNAATAQTMTLTSADIKVGEGDVDRSLRPLSALLTKARLEA